MTEREEDDAGATDEIFSRHITDVETAIVGIVAIVAHHEIMPGRNDIFLRVVAARIRRKIQRVIDLAGIRQPLAIDRDVIARLLAVVRRESAMRLARHGLAVDVKDIVLNLDAIARQAHDALDVVDIGIRREAEDDDVAALRLTAEDAAAEQVRRERQRILRIAISKLVDEDIVADKKRRHHRAGRNSEWLKENRADDHGQDERLHDDLNVLPQGVLLFYGFLGHAVLFLFRTPPAQLAFTHSLLASYHCGNGAGAKSNIKQRFSPLSAAPR
ncbi:hypothetical protein RHSP_34952 [Rhizobium freirei PRF 81]|uniref:Uncharacterized protein n=1 Tax=Rhizobium freirei PRF 81 TaxID=363754 RepID=N6V5F6_9HYPH|nr:hypothetical protein RHSP_34952 [Rhizobium freirei PRF 81]